MERWNNGLKKRFFQYSSTPILQFWQIAMIQGTTRPNLLLWGLIIISVGVHLILLMHIAGVYRPDSPVYIELDLRTISTPIQRNIPRPQPIPDPKIVPEKISPLSIPEEKLFRNEITTIPPLESLLPKNGPEALRLPEIPEIKGIDIATWEGEIEKPARHQEDLFKTEEKIQLEVAYKTQVRQLVLHKAEGLYRKKARKRQLQGRTVVLVVIGDSGDIVTARIAESSNYRMLDQIALKAVENASPFPKPPGGSITLYIPINFKLI